METVRLKGLDPIAFLESQGGVVKEDSGSYSLEGDFCLVVRGAASSAFTFSRNAFVAKDGTAWVLIRLPQTFFTFTGSFTWQDDPRGPSLTTDSAWLMQVDADHSAFLSLDTSRVSLIGHLRPSAPGRLLYPNATGTNEVALISAAHPEDPNRSGYFILPFENGFAVALGAVNGRINLDHAVVTQIAVHDDCDLHFVLGTGFTSVVLDASKASTNGGAPVLSSARSGLAMAADPGQPSWAPVRIASHRIEAKNGWIRTTRLAPGTAWIARVADHTAPVADATGIFAPTERLAYELDIPGPAAADPRARLIYGSVLATDAVSAGDRHFGVRVRGLGSRTGVPAVLDANVAVFDLAGAAGSKEMHLRAGDTVPVGDGTAPSVLVPKKNWQTANGDRVLEVPVAESALRVVARSATDSPMTVNTGMSPGFVLHAPHLVAPPVGMSAHSASAGFVDNDRFTRWALSRPAAKSDLRFDLGGATLKPIDQDWLSAFSTSDTTTKYRLLEHPGGSVAVDEPPSLQAAGPRDFAAVDDTERTTVTTVFDKKEVLRYSALVAVLSYAGYQRLGEGRDKAQDPAHVRVRLTKLTDNASAYVRRNGLRDLQVVFSVANGYTAELHKFIDDNMMDGGGGKPDVFIWPLAPALNMLLYEKGSYCDDIAGARQQPPLPAPVTGIAFDLSAEHELDYAALGWNAADWQDLRVASKTLWPRGSGRNGASLDPSAAPWRGIFFRDVPLYFQVPDEVRNKSEFVGKLLDTINEHLMLQYGWHDETGATWYGSLQSTSGIRFTPAAWSSVLDMWLTRITLQGTGSRVASAEGECIITLNQIKVRDAAGNSVPLKLRGAFVLQLDGGDPVPRIEITSDGDVLKTDSIPGFQMVALRRVVINGLTTAQFDLDLVAAPELSKAIPAFSADKDHPQRASLRLDFGKDPVVELSMTLPSTIDTNLFGRWPITLEAILVRFGTGASDPAELRIRGRIHLGLPAFSAVGCWISVKASNPLSFDVVLESVSGELSLGDLRIEAGLKWTDQAGVSGPVPLSEAPQHGKNRDFYGDLAVKGSDLFGDLALRGRVGNVGELSFWIAAISTSADVSLGFAKIKEPALLIAHHAEWGTRMRDALLAPTGAVLKALRPGAGADQQTWLSKWTPSKEIGTLVAASGYLHLHDTIASAPDGTNPDAQLSSLLFTDSGIVRVEGVAKLLGVSEVQFAFAVDFPGRTITAGFQAPEIAYPSADNPQYVVNTGAIVVSVGFKSNPRLGIWIGWPEQVAGSAFERDWSKAIKVRVASMVPINTFWGGVHSELDFAKKKFVMGWAIRAGWTWSADAGFGGVAKGHADLGIALGGVFQFIITLSDTDEPLALGTAAETVALRPSPADELARSFVLDFLRESPADEELFAASFAAVDAMLSTFSADLGMVAEIFGDIWGDASVEFLGITLVAIHIHAFARFVVCGSVNTGITRADARIGFDVSVKILCVTFSVTATLDITLKSGSCPSFLALNGTPFPAALPALIPQHV